MTIHYQDDSFLFSASSVIASFADGVEVPLKQVTFRGSTPMGEEWILSETSIGDDDTKEQQQSTPPRIVRLVMIPPELDWRRNGDYIWKLDNAWMSDQETAWLHWNSNSYINSVIQLPSKSVAGNNNNNTILECDVMEFHLEAILPSGFRLARDPIVTDTRIVLRDVQLGAYLNGNSSNNNNDHDVYNPCHPGVSRSEKNDCTIVDGAIASSTSVASMSIGGIQTVNDWWSTSPLWQKLVASGGVVALIVILLALFVNLLRMCRHWQRTNRYEQINPTQEEEDLTLDEHEDEDE